MPGHSLALANCPPQMARGRNTICADQAPYQPGMRPPVRAVAPLGPNSPSGPMAVIRPAIL